MKFVKQTSLLIVILLVIGCTETEKKSNELNVKDIISTSLVANIDSLNIEYEIVTLESNDKTLFSGITKAVVTDDYIFTLTPEVSVYQYDRKGNFIRQISAMGRGPNEYQHISDIFIDEQKNDRIYLFDMVGGILEYDFEGNHIAVYPKKTGTTKALFDNGVLYESVQVFSGIEPDKIRIGNLAGEQAQTIANNVKFKFNGATSGAGGSYSDSKSLFKLDQDIIYHQQATDTVFTLKDNCLTPRYIFNFGREMTEAVYHNFNKKIYDLQLLYDYTEDKNFIYPTFADIGWKIAPYLINKADKKAYKLELYFDEDKSLLFIPRWSYEDILVDVVKEDEGGDNERFNIVLAKIKEMRML